jgi:hypothetical protein
MRSYQAFWEELIALLEAGDIDEAEYLRRLRRRTANLRSSVWRQAGMIPISSSSVSGRAARDPIGSSLARRAAPGMDGYYATRLRDGTLGYLQRDVADCLRAALASLLQIPMPNVPEMPTNKLLSGEMDAEEFERVAARRLDRWTAERGLTARFHASPRTSGRWIGVLLSEEWSVLNDHCLLMSGRDCLFDPGTPVPRPLDEPTDQDLADIDYAITVERR